MGYTSDAGIYKITNLIDNKFYIGSSKNIYKRWNQHKTDLKNNKHHNSRLQNAYNKYGKENFIYEILENVDLENLIDKEQQYIDELKACEKGIGYNLNNFARGGGFAVGSNNGWFGKGHLQEGELNPFYGKEHAEETLKKLSEHASKRKGSLNSNFGNTGEKNPLSKPTLQVDINTMKVVNRFSATIEIKRILGFDSSNICEVCLFLKKNKARKKYKDFYWCYEEDLDILLKSKPFVSSQVKSVVKLDIETKELLEVFPTVSLAAQSVNMGRESISRACKGKIKYSAGYKWMYLEEYEKLKSAN